MKAKYLIFTARFFSVLFRPFYMPLVGFIALFYFTFLDALPLRYKLTVLVTVYLFTVLMPRMAIFCYRKLNGWASHQLSRRERRVVPYILSMSSYLACLYVMDNTHMPNYMSGIIVSALLVQLACAFINIWWKISTHSAGAGGLIGALVTFSFLFMFNVVGWLCLAILLAGVVGTSRMILRQHTLGQVMAGTAVGILFGILGFFMP